ncbi:MAG TPA: hypothetical protein PL112_07790 [Candidatus Obscuribacter sp.]|nr:hypothetical protein [Candidatus Obscuribacter sp.]HND66679.1 hypothetical protein [Candidatus Obscuribacter sp.]
MTSFKLHINDLQAKRIELLLLRREVRLCSKAWGLRGKPPLHKIMMTALCVETVLGTLIKIRSRKAINAVLFNKSEDRGRMKAKIVRKIGTQQRQQQATF